MRNIRRHIAWCMLLALLSWQVQADGTIPITTKGELNIYWRMMALPSCQVSGDKVITVVFGNVAINRIDSGEFIRPLPYYLTNCGTTANTVQMRFKATPGGFDASLMSTSVTGLEVKILKDGQPLALNQPFNIADPQHPPELKMQLVKAPGVKLQESPFTATGTLLVDNL